MPFTGGLFDQNEKYSFVIGANTTIKGYSLGTDGMKIGGTRVVLIPPDYGYGNRAIGNKIPANSTLAFLITLNDAVLKNPPQQQQQQQQPVQQQPVQQQPVQQQPVQQQQQQYQQQEPTPQPAQPFQQPQQQAPPQMSERRPSTTLEKIQKAGGIAMPMTPMQQQQQQQYQQQQQQYQQPPQQQQQPAHQQLFNNDDDDEDEAVVNTTFVPTIDEEDVLKRIDQLGDLIKSKFDNLVLEAPVSLKPRDLVYEIQTLASQIEDQERQLKEQEQLIDELKKSKQNSRLKAELDIAQTELQSLRSVLKGGKDYRRENDELKFELRQLKEEKIQTLQDSLSDLRTQLANAHDISQAAAGTKTKELFFSFMGAAIDKLQSIFAGSEKLNSKEVTDKIYEVFHQCSEDVFKQIDERGII
ncbi:peptidyl-prolyl cis-trans isomerase, FKBP-type family protein [Tritrichomonas foetus]|uniref:peptidylprolyl isomerase n=1 Tax=Tritrichomonas foetus TaxID=1144522 RepID=A0A1J4KP07_9EUKA|nr:peptidyl-prolyl cis-trans isomerase, FKBP-type family protein [Tritrichomonas foetus]|eukprot:OHT11438.1 peptidyl-prolyl cis-trans isomerase, FKBP-type family protein [Tritrichomonas foetus]